ncbi:MAG: hypothetical protein B5M54_00645 [Candidatus Aminicenantes bacterium 4484_214]|nr:MAG: hypothetical protein B5M54_00645 [Candidatus Aminicenantes bacterium 4484_214]
MVRKKYSPRQLFTLAGGIVLSLLLITFYIWHLSESIRLGYEINQLEKKLETVKKEIAQLEAEKTALLDPGKVERIAREKLKLSDPRPEQIIYLQLDQDLNQDD